ncbi:hypothetical protein M409DRAFT_19847 [Zasmidium cellare ATCC 36951]|uniref:Peptidase A1 domain-containing protein n=1 Tax=Zasmidium cellare ATCC 36951 TaxID=1080233 RepID=A0A6A6CT52_ZASCE|nr:uncharacterized protein M409DRAFT_19847 [Zasmidium cellare ATCC 36951]KAF2170245.1 hypothetical protein M409DRAFT_19847 [Zasmidium cellare ATCC 36951]
MASLMGRLLLLPSALLALSASYAYASALEIRDDNSTTVPAPISFSPDQSWLGIDGSWSTFTLRVGTPAQSVKALISFASYQTWVVLPQGCQAATDEDACAQTRGGIFDNNTSSTFEYIGIYDLWIERNLGYDGNAIYGYDVVGLGLNGQGGPTLKNTTVGALAVEDFYLGMFGVNPKPTNFTSFNEGSPSYITQLKEQNYIPSVSFGYTAGAKYRFTGALASLTLGGYDSFKFVDNDVTFQFAADNSRDLVVAIQSINTPSQIKSSPNPTELLPNPIYAYIDATVPQIWLPLEACQVFENEFGLIYDNTTELYLVNNTLHQALLDRDANVTFQFGQGFTGANVQVTLPYAAFDLEVQPPYPNIVNTTKYFPLRRAMNATQYTLGRTFLQEAYIAVDWESATFNVSQVLWQETQQQNLIPIVPISEKGGSGSGYPGTNTAGDNDESSSSLSGGAIAGIAVGAVAGVVILALAALFFYRRKNQSSKKAIDEKTAAASGNGPTLARQSSRQVYPKAELEGNGTPIMEGRGLLSAHASTPRSAPGTPHSVVSPASAGYFAGGAVSTPSPTTPSGEGTHSSTQSNRLFSPLSETASEADSRERHIYEMPGDMPVIREKDGKALSEKEALARRQMINNGVDSASNSASVVNEGVREPRRIDPQEVVQSSSQLRDPTLHRQFSFEMDSEQ